MPRFNLASRSGVTDSARGIIVVKHIRTSAPRVFSDYPKSLIEEGSIRFKLQ
jgi:hypothetical protein